MKLKGLIRNYGNINFEHFGLSYHTRLLALLQQKHVIIIIDSNNLDIDCRFGQNNNNNNLNIVGKFIFFLLRAFDMLNFNFLFINYFQM